MDIFNKALDNNLLTGANSVSLTSSVYDLQGVYWDHAIEVTWTGSTPNYVDTILYGGVDSGQMYELDTVRSFESPSMHFVNGRAARYVQGKYSDLSSGHVSGSEVNMRVISGGNGFSSKHPEIDKMTGAQVGITYGHHKAHAGYSYYFTAVDTIGNNAVKDIIFRTADSNKLAHYVGQVKGTEPLKVLIYASPTVNSLVSQVPVCNRNFDKHGDAVFDPESILWVPSSVTAVGSLHYNEYVGTGKVSGGGTRDVEENILKRNTDFLLRIQSLANNNIISSMFGWYEETDRS